MIAIVLLLATFAFAIIVMRNFGRGLKTSSKEPLKPACLRNITNAACSKAQEDNEGWWFCESTSPRREHKLEPHEHRLDPYEYFLHPFFLPAACHTTCTDLLPASHYRLHRLYMITI